MRSHLSKPPSRFFCFGCSLLWASFGQAQEAENPLTQALAIGAYYAEGDYGEDADTDIWYFPLSYEVDRGNWGFQLLVPHLEVTGLGNVLINVGGLTRAVAGSEVTRSSGLGDTIASVTYNIEPNSFSAPFIELRLDVKIPTADETKSLGTGEYDYSLQVDVTKQVGNVAVFATAGYSYRGESSIFEGLEDSAFATLGVAMPISERWSGGVFYDFREPASSFMDETHELVPYLNWQFNSNWSFTGLATWGFTDASADLAVLGQLRYSW